MFVDIVEIYILHRIAKTRSLRYPQHDVSLHQYLSYSVLKQCDSDQPSMARHSSGARRGVRCVWEAKGIEIRPPTFWLAGAIEDSKSTLSSFILSLCLNALMVYDQDVP